MPEVEKEEVPPNVVLYYLQEEAPGCKYQSCHHPDPADWTV